MKISTVNKVSTTTFEINDDVAHKQSEFHGRSYIPLFKDFIRSLGFDVQDKFPDSKSGNLSENILIDDVEFKIYDGNASYMSKNSYIREESVRKPQNRFMALEKRYGRDGYVVKVFINKEHETEKLRKKINDAIAEYHNDQKEMEERKDNDKTNTTLIANHFLNHLNIYKSIFWGIRIHEGKISFIMKDCGTLVISTDGSFNKFHPTIKEVEQETQLNLLYENASSIQHKVTTVLDAIKSAGQISEELKTWAAKAYECSFDVEKMEYSNY